MSHSSQPQPQPLPQAPSDGRSSERQLAERLFRVAPDVYRIPLPTDFPVGDVNAYLLDGGKPVLIDTGVAAEASLATLAQALEPLGRQLSEIDAVLLTHVHVDHAGSAQAIRERSGAEVYLHPRAHRRLRDVAQAHDDGLRWYRDFMLQSGFDSALVDRYQAASGLFLHYAASCPELEPLEQGDVVELSGGRCLEVHETFGHTSHHLSYWLEDERLLFSGDHLLPHITSNPTLEAPEPEDEHKQRPLALYQESLPRVAQLEATLACPGHALPFSNVAARCEQLARHQRRRCRQVRDAIAERESSTRKELSLALFGKVPLWEIYLTLSEVQAAVEWLEAAGEVRLTRVDGVDRIEPA